MKLQKKLLFALFVLFVSAFSSNVFSQDVPINCNSYDSLYNTIKSGLSATINKTAYIKEFALVEKSIITIMPVTSSDLKFTVSYKIVDLKYDENQNDYETGSVLGYMVTGCQTFRNKYKEFINTSCSLVTLTPEEARDAAKNGIDFSVDAGYQIEGSLVKVFDKICKNDPGHTVVKKPAVYLYPEKEMNVSVNVEVNGKLTFTEPEYKNGWTVNVKPDGTIDNKYDYLFYEADLNKIELPDEGWIVEYNKIDKWFDEFLPEFGLNEKESKQFKEYWLKELDKANYYEIKILSNDFLNENMKLKITPEPQTLLRLNFYFKPLSEKKIINSPIIKRFERKGFTVVEWGGINVSNIISIP